MKRTRYLFCGMTLLSSVVAVGQDVPPPAPNNTLQTVQNGSTKAAKVPQREPVDQLTGRRAARDEGTASSPSRAASSERSADEEAILLTALEFVKAYNTANSDAIAALYTADADDVDEDGNAYQGREAIAAAVAACWVKNPGAQIEMHIDSLRFVGPGAAVEDGSTIVRSRDEGGEPIETRYTAVHLKVDGKWLTASVREHAATDRHPHRTQLEQLAWLLGDWVDEGEDTLVVSSCKPVSGGNFLVRNYKVHVAGQEATSGTQRIGWDAKSGKLKSWVFDAKGGYNEGFWQRESDRWILKSSGVTADGQTASSTVIFTLVNSDTMTWQLVDHEISGKKIPDSDVVTIVRRAPAPESAPENALTTSQ